MLSNIAPLNARRGLRCGLVCTVAMVVFLGGDREASATFPGRNGDIFVTRWDISSQQSSGGAIRVDAVSGQIRDGLSVCHHQFYGSPDPLSDSTYCYRSGPAAISPDGRTAAVIGKDVHDGIAPLSEGLRLLSLTDGERQLIPFTNPADIATANVGGGDQRVRWSPDGRQVLIDRPLTSTGGHTAACWHRLMTPTRCGSWPGVRCGLVFRRPHRPGPQLEPVRRPDWFRLPAAHLPRRNPAVLVASRKVARVRAKEAPLQDRQRGGQTRPDRAPQGRGSDMVT